MSINLKTPITYYGGKQKLAKKIISLLTDHVLYCEPFVGGGAIFFGKQPSEIEVINDTNKSLMNFYRVLQNNFIDLEKQIKITLHSREMHRTAGVIYENPSLFTELQQAWAVWVRSSQSFCAMLDGSWGYDKTENKLPITVQTKKERFTEDLAIRLQNVQLECADALYIIKSRDRDGALFYCDPPYYNSDCGHYDGYSERDFEDLLILLSRIKGKFLLSSYPSDLLKHFTRENKWNTWSIQQNVTVGAKSGYQKKKVEVLTANYPIE